jgi:hypothetical protein
MNPSPSLLHKNRCSDDIKLRIQALQLASGCCLDTDDDETTAGQTRQTQQRHSAVPSTKSTLVNNNNSKSTMDYYPLRTSIQLPLTPNVNDTIDDDEEDPSSSSSKRSSVSFADMTDVCFIPPVFDVDHDSLYYKDDELAEFRHEAFLEECGLSHMMT